MKLKLLIIFVLVSFFTFSQWNVESDTNFILYKTENDLFYIDSSGIGYYCGLYPDDEDYVYTYYRRVDRNDLVFFKELSLKNEYYTIGFLQLKNKKVYSNIYDCWTPCFIWLYFDNSDKLIRQEFYSDGEIINPQIFKVPPLPHEE